MPTVTYSGPPEQACHALADHGYSPIAEPGASYELPAELAESLVASSAHWHDAGAGTFDGVSAKAAITRVAAMTVEQLDQVTGETRKSVLAAIEKRRAELVEEES